MRTSVAALGGIVILFVGFFGLSQQASQVKDVAVTNGTNATAGSYNLATEVFGGLGITMSSAVVWMGIAALILVVMGYLVVAGNSGR
jgi:hypothetical protein